MNKINCDIIQDLLPLYVDDVCSQASKQMIEVHLDNCNICKEKVQELKKDNISIHLTEEKNELFKKLAASVRLRKTCLILICIITAFVMIIFGNKVYERMVWSTDEVVGYDKVNVLDVCQLSDGRIAFHTIVEDGYRVNGASWHEEYLYPQISLERGKIKFKNVDDKKWMETFTFNNCYWVFSSEKGKISYIDENGNEKIIWQKGDTIPKASEDFDEKLINRKNGFVKNEFE